MFVQQLSLLLLLIGKTNGVHRYRNLISVEKTQGWPSNSASKHFWLKCFLSISHEVEFVFHWLIIILESTEFGDLIQLLLH